MLQMIRWDTGNQWSCLRTRECGQTFWFVWQAEQPSSARPDAGIWSDEEVHTSSYYSMNAWTRLSVICISTFLTREMFLKWQCDCVHTRLIWLVLLKWQSKSTSRSRPISDALMYSSPTLICNPRCELRIGRVSESNRCYTVRKGLWERTTLGRRYFFPPTL